MATKPNFRKIKDLSQLSNQETLFISVVPSEKLKYKPKNRASNLNISLWKTQIAGIALNQSQENLAELIELRDLCTSMITSTQLYEDLEQKVLAACNNKRRVTATIQRFIDGKAKKMKHFEVELKKLLQTFETLAQSFP